MMSDFLFPSGWTKACIRELISADGLISDGDWVESKDQDPNGSIRLVQLADIGDGDFRNKSKRFMSEDKANLLRCTFLEEGDVLVARMPDPLGRACLFPGVGQRAVTVVDICLIRTGKSSAIYNGLLKYWINSPDFRDLVNANSSGTTRKRITRTKLEEFEVPVPPLAEQKVIADKLDTLLAQVENTKARLERIPKVLKRFRQSVLAAAVSGRLTEEWRRSNPAKTTESLLSAHEPLPRPARWKSRSESFIAGDYAIAVGKPESSDVEGWSWVPLVEVARMESGHTPSRSKPEYWGGEVCWIGIRDANLNHGRTILSTEQKTNEIGLANSASRLLPAGTVCISRTASVGYVVKMGRDMATSQDFVNWVPTKVIDSDWLKWLFVAERESLFRFGKGSTHTTVYFPEWLAMHILLPHVDEQREIARRLDQLLARADHIEQQVNNALARVNGLTQSILAKAFRGELTEQWREENPDLISGENSAEALLEKIRAARSEVGSKPRAKRSAARA